MESLLLLDTWNDVVQENAILNELRSDVEALLVIDGNDVILRFHSTARPNSIECYKLVGLIRMHWRGLSGGTEVWREVGNFFKELKVKAGAVNGEHHA
jgi:hypothetical protein